MHLVAYIWDRLAAKLSKFRSDRRGNMVMLFALSIPPMVGLTGLGIDYSMTLRAKLALDASTDAAVLAAATEASQIIQTQSTASYDATAVAIQLGTAAGQNVFTANSAMIATQSKPTLTLSLKRQGYTIAATGSYSAAWPTTFGQLFDSPTMSFSGSATSSLTLPKYMNIYVATDISQSMGIAATQADMSTLSGLTKGCVFGCHVLQSGQSGQTNEQIAHANNVTLRIDVIKQSIQQMIASAAAVSSNKPTISIGLYTLQELIPSDGTSYYNRITAPTTNYATLNKLAAGIDLGNNDGGGTGDTDFAKSVPLFNSNEVATSGNGTGTADAQSFVFLMTDGVQDVKGNCTDGHCTSPFDPNLCAALRSKGVTIGVIYTTYIPFPNEQTYVDLVAPFQSKIGPNLQSCASPGYYYEASDGPAIKAAVNNLFAQAVAAGRLTQ